MNVALSTDSGSTFVQYSLHSQWYRNTLLSNVKKKIHLVSGATLTILQHAISFSEVLLYSTYPMWTEFESTKVTERLQCCVPAELKRKLIRSNGNPSASEREWRYAGPILPWWAWKRNSATSLIPNKGSRSIGVTNLIFRIKQIRFCPGEVFHSSQPGEVWVAFRIATMITRDKNIKELYNNSLWNCNITSRTAFGINI